MEGRGLGAGGGGGGSEASGGELTDVAPSLSLAGGDTSIISVATKGLSRQTRPSSGQKYACRDKFFVATKLCLLRQIFVATTVLLRQAYFCRDERRVLSRQKPYLWHLQPMVYLRSPR